MNRYVIILAAIVLTVTSVAAFADTGSAPAGAIRWDPTNPTEPPVSKGIGPEVYRLTKPFTWPEDIEVDDEGCFYVVCHIRQSITKFRPDGTFDKLWREDTEHPCRGGGMDMAVLPGERIYLASDHWLPTIRRFGPDPNVVESLEGVFPAGCIAAEDNGAYYLHHGLEVKVYSADGKPQGSWKAENAGSMALGPDGNIYMPVSNQPIVAVYSRTGELVRSIDLSGLSVASSSWKISVDTNGDIYLSCSLGIVRLDNAGKPIAYWRPYGTLNNDRYSGTVTDVAVRNGLVYALLRHTGGPPEVQSFTPDGQCIARYVLPKPAVELPLSVLPRPDGGYAVHQSHTSWGQDWVLLYDSEGKRAGSIFDNGESPGGDAAVSPAGGYYVARDKRLERVDADGRNPVVLSEDGQFVEVSVDETTGNLYARTDKRQIKEFGPDGKLLRTISLSAELGLGSSQTLSTLSVFMALDGKGFIYIADTDNHRIVKLDMNGNKVGEFGREGSGLGELRRPKGLTVDPEGRVIVADTRNHRIQVFSPAGKPLGFWGRLGIGDGELDRPHGVSIVPGKMVYIADTHNDRVVTVPWDRFWQQVSTETRSTPAYEPRLMEAITTAGDVTVEGIVIAGSNDFSDCIYIQAADRSWGARVTLPTGVLVTRGQRIRVTGLLELKERASKQIIAKKVDYIATIQNMPPPLGMANLYVGDGYRMGSDSMDLSNLGLLIKSWGKVVSVDAFNKRFVITDGSKLGSASGLEVYGGQLKTPITLWPSVGQYVMVTGVSAVRPVGDGTFRSAVRLRCQEDLQVMAGN